MNIVKLIIVQFYNKQAQVLSLNKDFIDLPCGIINEEYVLSINSDNHFVSRSCDVFTENVDLSLAWIKLKLIDATINPKDGYAEIYHGVMIPFNTTIKNKNAYWIDIKLDGRDEETKYVIKALQKLGGISYE